MVIEESFITSTLQLLMIMSYFSFLYWAVTCSMDFVRNLLTNFVSNSRFLELKTKKQQDLLHEEYLFWSWDQKITAGQKMPKFYSL